MINELKFQIDETLRGEIEKVEKNVADVRNSIQLYIVDNLMDMAKLL